MSTPVDIQGVCKIRQSTCIDTSVHNPYMGFDTYSGSYPLGTSLLGVHRLICIETMSCGEKRLKLLPPQNTIFLTWNGHKELLFAFWKKLTCTTPVHKTWEGSWAKEMYVYFGKDWHCSALSRRIVVLTDLWLAFSALFPTKSPTLQFYTDSIHWPPTFIAWHWCQVRKYVCVHIATMLEYQVC